ncbi:hypothetical protein RB195_006251 [Necator americanus]|uniref:Uncharacterized protein n=1 Tax=Necator americanus TaxID=51031 RepID=A0ABR1BVB3_NECAM
MESRNFRSPPLYAGRGSQPVEDNGFDHIIVSKRFCMTDVAVVPKFYMGSDHRSLQGDFRLLEEKGKPPSSESEASARNTTGFTNARGRLSSKIIKRRHSPEILEVIRDVEQYEPQTTKNSLPSSQGFAERP